MALTESTQTTDLRRDLDAANAENADLAQMLGAAIMALNHPGDTDADRAQAIEHRIRQQRGDLRELALASHAYVRGSGLTEQNRVRLESVLDRPGVRKALERS